MPWNLLFPLFTMSSLLSIQLSQQNKAPIDSSSLPSPPNSFCGDEKGHRDSLPTVFSDMTIKDYSVSLPENYTIDHSKKIPISTTTAASTGGLTIRKRRQSEMNINKRKSSFTRGLSESFSGQYRCNDCGKSYKSHNCLQKHRWEHSEEWELTKKLPLTKHQQVQMLEAAAILIGMDRRQPKYEQDIDLVDKQKDKNFEDLDSEESIVIDDDEEDILSTTSSGIFMEDI